MHVLYFAGARDAAGDLREENILLSNPISLNELGKMLVERHPQLLGILDICVISVNLQITNWNNMDLRIQNADEVALIPPVSGG